MRQIKPSFLGTKFVVKYWHAKHENRECCPQHGALHALSVALAFSAVTIAISEPFLLPAAENWYPETRHVLAPIAQFNVYRQTTMAIGLEPQHGALNVFYGRLHLARIGFKLWSAKTWPHCSPKNQFSTIFGPGTAQKWLRNGYRNG